MLNRLFIVIGLLAILLLAAAFIVPRFIAWGDYRPRLEAMASEVLGAKVEIIGDIEFSLLPQPQLKMQRVVVGASEAPVMMIEGVEAEFSLFDFLRDQYRLSKLVLDRPILEARIDADGHFDTGLTLADEVTTANVSVANATIIGGSVRLADQRSGKVLALNDVAGDLKIEALRGPFAFQGSGTLDSAPYNFRVSTAKVDEEGGSQVALFARPADESFSLNIDGQLKSGAEPHFSGNLTYRQTPPKPKQGETVDAGRGDLVLTSSIEASTARALLPAYVMVPDENRAATRLTGALEINLGARPSFNAVVSGGVIALPPRDATAELSEPPYEMVRLLGELPLPPVPAMEGVIGLDIAELNLRAVSLRNLRLDAATDTKSWTIKDFSAALPGGASIDLKGNLSVVDKSPIFAGGIAVAVPRLDALARLWRKPGVDNPLANLGGSLSADIALSNDTLTLSSGDIVVNDINQRFDVEIGFGASRRLKLDAHFTTLGPVESAAFAALLPDPKEDSAFGASFPKGQFNISASKAIINGLEGTELSAIGSWEGGVLEFSKLKADDLGGAAFDGKLTAFGSFAKPEISGAGKLAFADGDAPALRQVLDWLETPKPMQDYLARWVPAALNLQLDAPNGDGSQALTLDGKTGFALINAEIKLAHGVAEATRSQLSANIVLNAPDPTLMTAQLGLGAISITPEDAPMQISAHFNGTAASGFAAGVAIAGGGDSIGFEGDLTGADPKRLSGKGVVKVALSDPGVLAERLGVSGVFLPALNGSARLEFSGLGDMRLNEIVGTAGESKLVGALELVSRGDTHAISGNLALDHFDVVGLLPLLAGPQATLTSADGVWPDGPLDLGAAPRATIGHIGIAADSISAGARPLISGAAFNFDWDATGSYLRNLKGGVGGGTLAADISVCCSGALPDKQISGRLTLQDVALDAIAPPIVAEALDGVVSGSAAFTGTGDSLAAAIAALTGSGSYTVKDFSIAHFDPEAFEALRGIENVGDMKPEALSALLLGKLEAGIFSAPELSGAFTIAGGVLRNPNVAMEGETARVFGGVDLDLRTLGLKGSYLMTPTGVGADANAQANAVLSGRLDAPERVFDVTAMVDAIMVEAYEAEVARLEKLRLEDEARQKAAAEEKARIAAEQKAAADKAAEEKRLADEAAKKKAQEAPALDLGL